jgi:hypothetical protein
MTGVDFVNSYLAFALPAWILTMREPSQVSYSTIKHWQVTKLRGRGANTSILSRYQTAWHFQALNLALNDSGIAVALQAYR